MTHGGIIATILDEVMAWALVAEDNWGVTARMTLDFKRPVAVGTKVRAEGWIVRSRRRLIETAGQIVDARRQPSWPRPRRSTSRPARSASAS